MHMEKEDGQTLSCCKGIGVKIPREGSLTDWQNGSGWNAPLVSWVEIPRPTSLPKQGSLEYITQSCVQMAFASLQGRRPTASLGSLGFHWSLKCYPVFLSCVCDGGIWKFLRIASVFGTYWMLMWCSYWLEMRSKESQGMVLSVLAGQPGDVSSQLLNIKAVSYFEGICVQRGGNLVWVP